MYVIKGIKAAQPNQSNESFTKPSFSIGMDEHLLILKNMHDKYHTHEQNFGDVWVLSTQNYFPPVLNKHQ